jgi:hypothetical protein
MRATCVEPGERPGTSLQDTFKSSRCTNRLFPTADCPASRYPISP